MGKWQRFNYQPCLPLGEDGRRITGSAEHIALSRKAAAEGMALLKNTDGALPLKKGTKVALLGKATIDYVKGGGGSGDVTVAYVHNLADGMAEKQAAGKVDVFGKLVDFYRENVKAQYEGGAVPGLTVEPEIPADLLKRAADFADTAIVSISRFSGEGWDRTVKSKTDIRNEYALWPGENKERDLSSKIFEYGDFYLSDAEQKMVDDAKTAFAHVIVVMNVGGMVDTEWFHEDDCIDAVLMSWQGGMAGGDAAADVLCGEVNPSGRLVDTFAKELTDYPSSYNFHESADFVEYTDDIFVGYRYFETIPGAAERVNYPFGFGLSYTEFEISDVNGNDDDGEICFTFTVTNKGEAAGREVVQLYYSAPQGELGKAAKVLIGFMKTKELAPGESETGEIRFAVDAMASYDDTGKISKSAWVLEKGDYRFFIGENVRDAKEADFCCTLVEDIVTEQVSEKAAPHKLSKKLKADGTYEELAVTEYPADKCGLTRQDTTTLEGRFPNVRAVTGKTYMDFFEKKNHTLMDVAEGKLTLDAFVEELPIEVRIDLLGGQPNTGVANTFGFGNQPDYGIPNVMTADGPAGLRVQPQTGVTTTAWPCATLLASTWDEELVYEVGKAAAMEVKENNIGIWLTPAMNIHRSPLCGRNFEYYSEDPFVAGKTGSAMVRGIQSQNIAACPKHFAANNKETNRKASDSRVSERALREIYLKQFEIMVKESHPYTLMSSYNLINGIPASENGDLLTGVLRDEWGFDGVVTTDWWNLNEHYLEAKAGNDVKMACGYPERLKEAYDKGLITEEEINREAKRMLELILKFD